MEPERCKCGTDAMGGCRLHNAAAARVLDGELKMALAARDEARAARDEAEKTVQKLRDALIKLANEVERDRREPDKVLLAGANARSVWIRTAPEASVLMGESESER